MEKHRKEHGRRLVRHAVITTGQQLLTCLERIMKRERGNERPERRTPSRKRPPTSVASRPRVSKPRAYVGIYMYMLMAYCSVPAGTT